jgi:hypothetical protein
MRVTNIVHIFSIIGSEWERRHNSRTVISFDDHVETSNTETDIARIVASRSIVDAEEGGELQIPEAYNEDVKNLVKSYHEALPMIQQLEEFPKKKECTTSLHLWMVKYDYEKQLTYQCKTVQLR